MVSRRCHDLVARTPSVYWFFGLSGSGETTLSKAVAHRLITEGAQCLVLDGDEMRAGLCRDLGFSASARLENIRRAAEVAKIACEQGLVVLAAFITPEDKMRMAARDIISPSPFYEIFLSCDYSTCSKRDVKGLYLDAAVGRISDFTGRDATFEIPLSADPVVDTQRGSTGDSINCIHKFIMQSQHTPSAPLDVF